MRIILGPTCFEDTVAEKSFRVPENRLAANHPSRYILESKSKRASSLHKTCPIGS